MLSECFLYCLTLGGSPGQSSSSNVPSGSGNQHPQAKRGSGKSGFFASLHPSRWTRGGSSGNSGSNSASSNNSNNNQPHPSGSSSNVERVHHIQLPTPGGGSSNSNRSGGNFNAYLAASYKEQVKTWLKEQSMLFTTKYCKKASESATATAGSTLGDDTSILPKLGSIIANIRSVRV